VAQRVPEYATKPVDRFIEYAQESERLLTLSMGAISKLIAMPDLLRILRNAIKTAEPHREDDDESRSSLERVEANAAFAKKEQENDFPLLHAHTVVGLWGAAEASIEDLLVGLLMNEPEHLRNEAFAKIRIPLASFETLEKEERMRLLVAEIKRSQPVQNRNGTDAFETLLKCSTLDGEIDPGIKRDIWEMNHIRNVIVHRASHADRRLVDSCPWLFLKPGERVSVSHLMRQNYYLSLCKYFLLLMYRLGNRYGIDIEKELRLDKEKAKGAATCETT
jgi:hypothetical protein